MTAAVIIDNRYFGHCSCPGRFRESMRALEKQISAGGQDRLCVMVPPITPFLETDVEKVLDLTADRENAELSLNDWGTLLRCARLKKEGSLRASLTVGVLLAGQDTDPLLSTFCEPQETQTVLTREKTIPDPADVSNCTHDFIVSDAGDTRTIRAVWKEPSSRLRIHWRTPSVLEILPFLREMGVDRIELCAQPLAFPKDTGDREIAVTFIPESILSVIPCTGNCHHCEAVTERIRKTKRGCHSVAGAANIIYTETDMRLPVWVDRAISIKAELTGEPVRTYHTSC